jgi:hypothetical protein
MRISRRVHRGAPESVSRVVWLWPAIKSGRNQTDGGTGPQVRTGRSEAPARGALSDRDGYTAAVPIDAEYVSNVLSENLKDAQALYEGGQLIWFVPSRPVFIDGRVEAYPRDFMLQARQADLEGDYRRLFSQYDIECAVTRVQAAVCKLVTVDHPSATDPHA